MDSIFWLMLAVLSFIWSVIAFVYVLTGRNIWDAD
jgi:hypothetical protein